MTTEDKRSASERGKWCETTQKFDCINTHPGDCIGDQGCLRTRSSTRFVGATLVGQLCIEAERIAKEEPDLAALLAMAGERIEELQRIPSASGRDDAERLEALRQLLLDHGAIRFDSGNGEYIVEHRGFRDRGGFTFVLDKLRATDSRTRT